MAVTAAGARDFLPRIVRAGLAIAGTYAILHLVIPAALGIDVVAALNRALAVASAALMNAAGFAVTRSDTVLTLHGASVVVTDDCNSVGAWLLVVGAMSALPSIPWRWRLAGMAASAVTLTLVNVVRISVLSYLRAEQPQWFGPVHEQMFPLVVVLVASACVVIWFTRVESAHHASTTMRL